MTAIVNETVSVKKKPSGRRVIFASAFGNALEFFDFGVYNFFLVQTSDDHNASHPVPIITSRCYWHLQRLV